MLLHIGRGLIRHHPGVIITDRRQGMVKTERLQKELCQSIRQWTKELGHPRVAENTETEGNITRQMDLRELTRDLKFTSLVELTDLLHKSVANREHQGAFIPTGVR